MSPTEPFNEEEWAAWYAINGAIVAIQELGIRANLEERVAAIHVLQGIVIQHMLHRRWPDVFASWSAS